MNETLERRYSRDSHSVSLASHVNRQWDFTFRLYYSERRTLSASSSGYSEVNLKKINACVGDLE